MSRAPVQPAKPSKTRQFRNFFSLPTRASPPSASQPSISTPTASTTQSPLPSLTQLTSSLGPSSAGLPATHSSNAGAALTPSWQAPTSPSSSRNLLEDALQDPKVAIIRQYILPNSSDISSAVEQALAVAEEKQQRCLEKRLTFTFAGKVVVLKEEVDKVVRWLNRVKSVGDIVVNVDPVHAGLPWAGIRLLLEVRVFSLKFKLTNVLINRLLYLKQIK